jgi:hypothetical protein
MSFQVLVDSVSRGQWTSRECDPLPLAQIPSDRLIVLMAPESKIFADEGSKIPEDVA